MNNETFIISPKKKIDLSPKSVLNPDIFGRWQHISSGREFLIAPNSFYYIIDGPHPYSVNSTTLDMDGWIFNRLHGSGSDILGVWIEPNTSEEINFRADGSYTWYDPAGIDTFGTYETFISPDTLKTAEARAFLTEIGNQLIFDAIFSGTYTYNFTVDQTNLTLTDPSTGDVIEYLRL